MGNLGWQGNLAIMLVLLVHTFLHIEATNNHTHGNENMPRRYFGKDTNQQQSIVEANYTTHIAQKKIIEIKHQRSTDPAGERMRSKMEALSKLIQREELNLKTLKSLKIESLDIGHQDSHSEVVKPKGEDVNIPPKLRRKHVITTDSHLTNIRLGHSTGRKPVKTRERSLYPERRRITGHTMKMRWPYQRLGFNKHRTLHPTHLHVHFQQKVSSVSEPNLPSDGIPQHSPESTPPKDQLSVFRPYQPSDSDWQVLRDIERLTSRVLKADQEIRDVIHTGDNPRVAQYENESGDILDHIDSEHVSKRLGDGVEADITMDTDMDSDADNGLDPDYDFDASIEHFIKSKHSNILTNETSNTYNNPKRKLRRKRSGNDTKKYETILNSKDDDDIEDFASLWHILERGLGRLHASIDKADKMTAERKANISTLIEAGDAIAAQAANNTRMKNLTHTKDQYDGFMKSLHQSGLEMGVLENRLAVDQITDELHRVDNLVKKQEAYQEAKDQTERSMSRLDDFPRHRYNITKENIESAEKYIQRKSHPAEFINEKENNYESAPQDSYDWLDDLGTNEDPDLVAADRVINKELHLTHYMNSRSASKSAVQKKPDINSRILDARKNLHEHNRNTLFAVGAADGSAVDSSSRNASPNNNAAHQRSENYNNQQQRDDIMTTVVSSTDFLNNLYPLSYARRSSIHRHLRRKKRSAVGDDSIHSSSGAGDGDTKTRHGDTDGVPQLKYGESANPAPLLAAGKTGVRGAEYYENRHVRNRIKELMAENNNIAFHLDKTDNNNLRDNVLRNEQELLKMEPESQKLETRKAKTYAKSLKVAEMAHGLTRKLEMRAGMIKAEVELLAQEIKDDELIEQRERHLKNKIAEKIARDQDYRDKMEMNEISLAVEATKRERRRKLIDTYDRIVETEDDLDDVIDDEKEGSYHKRQMLNRLLTQIEELGREMEDVDTYGTNLQNKTAQRETT